MKIFNNEHIEPETIVHQMMDAQYAWNPCHGEFELHKLGVG